MTSWGERLQLRCFLLSFSRLQTNVWRKCCLSAAKINFSIWLIKTNEGGAGAKFDQNQTTFWPLLTALIFPSLPQHRTRALLLEMSSIRGANRSRRSKISVRGSAPVFSSRSLFILASNSSFKHLSACSVCKANRRLTNWDHLRPVVTSVCNFKTKCASRTSFAVRRYLIFACQIFPKRYHNSM